MDDDKFYRVGRIVIVLGFLCQIIMTAIIFFRDGESPWPNVGFISFNGLLVLPLYWEEIADWWRTPKPDPATAKLLKAFEHDYIEQVKARNAGTSPSS